MLGKQWLNRCTPVNVRGTIIERSQYRQRKLDGIVKWYFDDVMESLPLMLQVALLLLGCALSRYLWEIDTTVATVILGFTTFGVLFYVFIVIAGVASESCPYQTPVANFLRHIPAAISYTPTLLHRSVQGTLRFIRTVLHRISYTLRRIRDMLRRVPNIFRHPPAISGTLRSVLSTVIDESWFCLVLTNTVPEIRAARHTLRGIAAIAFHILFAHVFLLPLLPIADSCRALIWVLVGFINWVRQARLEPHAERITKQQIAGHTLDLSCILWTLQASVDGPVRESALEYLATMTLDDFNPIQFVAGWFDILLICVQVADGNVTIIKGFELLAEKSSLFCLHMLSHLIVTDPTPEVLEDVRQRYTRVFPFKTNFGDLPVSHTLGIIHSVFSSNRTEGLGNKFLTEGPMRSLAPRVVRRRVQWDKYQPSSTEYTIVARALVKFAQFEYKRSGERAKVPRWLLRFALHSLSQDPPPPPSVIFDSLLIIAIDLECHFPDATTVKPLDQR